MFNIERVPISALFLSIDKVMRYRILSIFILLTAIFISSCKKLKESNFKSNIQNEIVMNQEDTVQVLSLVKTFMDALSEKRYADAVVMLHQIDSKNHFAKPELLDNDKIEETMVRLKRFPIRSYSIRDYEFKYSKDNTVRCTIEIEPVNKGDEPYKMTFALKPVRYIGRWHLCLR